MRIVTVVFSRVAEVDWGRTAACDAVLLNWLVVEMIRCWDAGMAPTCYGSSLPSSGSLLDPPELLEIQIGRVVYHITYGYVACGPGCRGPTEPRKSVHIVGHF
jgi:hypothetical protein